MVQKNTRDRLRLVDAAAAGMVPPALQDDLTQHSDAELIGYVDGVLLGLEAGLPARTETVRRARAALTELACRSLRTFGVEREVEALRAENNDLRAAAAPMVHPSGQTGAWVTVEVMIYGPMPGEPVDADGVPVSE